MNLRIERSGGIAELVLARPPVNALDGATLSEIVDACGALERDGEVRGVLLRGEGKCLSAGLDLSVFGPMDRAGAADFVARVDAAFRALFVFSKPLAVAVEGHAIAGGMLLALCGDFIAFGRGGHKVGLTELQVGVPFPPLAFEIARLALPPRALRTLVYGAESIPIADAFALGAGDVLIDDPRAAARAWLERTTPRPLGTFAFVKRLHRAEALARAADPAPRREEHLDLLLTARDVIAAALQATKR